MFINQNEISKDFSNNIVAKSETKNNTYTQNKYLTHKFRKKGLSAFNSVSTISLLRIKGTFSATIFLYTV